MTEYYYGNDGPYLQAVPQFLYPQHVVSALSKSVGATLTLQWGVVNSGGRQAHVDLRVYQTDTSISANLRGGYTPPLPIVPASGGFALLDISGPVNTLWSQNVPLLGILIIFWSETLDIGGFLSNPTELIRHTFPITVLPAAPVLAAQGDPVIT
jgi:hypothetical protein